VNNHIFWNTASPRAGLKGKGARAIFPGGALWHNHDVIACKIYIFADSQRSRLLFPVVDYVPAVLTRLLAALDCKQRCSVVGTRGNGVPTSLFGMGTRSHTFLH